MFLTETELINMKITSESKLNDSDIIKTLIQDDILSVSKLEMKTGEMYYNGEQDILKHNFNQTIVSSTDEDENEKLESFRNPNGSNHHNINPFHKILVDQKVSYIAAKEPSISVRGASDDASLKEYEKYLSVFCDEKFNEMLQDWIMGASNKGIEVLHVYYNKNGDFKYCIVPADEIIPIYDTEYQTELEQVIRYYDIKVTRNGRTYLQKRVEWWTKNDVTYYIQNDAGNYEIDSSVRYNPSPHWWVQTLKEGFTVKNEKHSWGRVPFIILKNNSKGTNDLKCIKGLIDAYDLISSSGTNNFLDFVDLYWVIEGYGGEAASSIVKKLQVNKSVHIDDTSGKVEAKQVDLPIEGRLEFLKMLRRDIFHFGMGVDVDNENFGSAPSGVSLKFRYAQLDLKVGMIIPKLKSAIKEFLWFVTDDYNRNNNASFDSNFIDIDINETIITNDYELVKMINESKGVVSDKTLLSKHPFVDDVNAEIEEIEAQQQKEENRFLNYSIGDGGESHENTE